MPTASGRAREVLSAGAVVLGPGGTVLLVHRPKYDDWSFPKGKLDRGEHVAAAAVREVEEETGVRIRLGVPLGSQRYPFRGGTKRVLYWVGRPVGRHDVGAYQPNAEIDEVGWFSIDKARRRLTYPHDVDTMDEALGQRRKTRTLVVVRHAQARSRRVWRGEDRLRPLLATGRQQAERLVPVLAAYDVRRLVSSSSTRCVETLEPYAASTRHRLRREDLLSEEGSTRRSVGDLVRGMAHDLGEQPASAGGLALCTHRPVLPWVFEAAGIDDPGLAAGEMMVLHLRRGEVCGQERHGVR